MRKISFFIISIIFIFAIFSNSSAETFSIGENTSAVGTIKYHVIQKGESLIELARQNALGYNEIVDANPEFDPFVPTVGSKIIIPKFWILPDRPEKFQGILINLSEMRLFYFYKKGNINFLSTFPIGIGDDNLETPMGKFKISHKVINPSWYVPESIRKERPELPAVVPPGPENPLGTHAMRLSGTSYLIHGTNRPWAVGRKVTHGCIRLYPEDIPKLFEIVPIGTEVLITRQPVKVGKIGDEVYVEVHLDEQLKEFDYLGTAINLLAKKGLLKYVDTFKLYNVIKQKNGIPTSVTVKNKEPQVITSDPWL
ncbi:MAG: L,D-transpeptidase family protein [Thermodesulfovibrio sp.]|uniref:L,D-transpeptidase family protein n=1 Tax=unclassified Thermodesulfovibrio TaxID=2645936 RepID=UPI000839EAF7|nr:MULTISPECIES: L,D-transpeptidase family protein [unclassified Thermodesulfovibrio]MDI1472216.1 L,D-transpeptidase family protein [Thermodesulfovibrio sp. 1176]MDI6714078.1 L,D-transpeptidase family protein [Thermodesulfovibrio sp.]ODA44594.1 ErfK/YbiS/YcfS/YnhG family protein [Thermodesulfovibrio sp. N1]